MKKQVSFRQDGTSYRNKSDTWSKVRGSYRKIKVTKPKLVGASSAVSEAGRKQDRAFLRAKVARGQPSRF